MTWKRRLAVIGFFVVLVCVGVGLTMLLTPDHRPGVTKANLDKLQEGMSKEQIRGLFGKDSAVSFYGGGLSGGVGLEAWVGEDERGLICGFLYDTSTTAKNEKQAA